jgi:hypothetical protein
MPKRLGLLVVVLAAIPLSAMAVEVTIGTESINLPTPRGFCEMSESNASDKSMITTLRDLIAKSGNKMLAMDADCGQLAAWHAGKRPLLDDFFQYQTPIAAMGSSTTPEQVRSTCADMRAEGDKLAAKAHTDNKSRIESALEGMKVNETTFIGVLAEEPTTCYAGLIQKFHTQANTDKVQLTLIAVTIVKNKSVFLYRFAVYGSDTVANVLAKVKADVAALRAANR